MSDLIQTNEYNLTMSFTYEVTNGSYAYKHEVPDILVMTKVVSGRMQKDCTLNGAG